MTQQELERAIQEVWALFRETDRKFKETDKKFKETDKKDCRGKQDSSCPYRKVGKIC